MRARWSGRLRTGIEKSFEDRCGIAEAGGDGQRVMPGGRLALSDRRRGRAGYCTLSASAAAIIRTVVPLLVLLLGSRPASRSALSCWGVPKSAVRAHAGA